MRRHSGHDRDAAFADFVSEATPSLTRTAWLLTGDAYDTEELVQAALVKTYVSWSRIEPGAQLAYARRTLVNHSTDTWRKTYRERLDADPPDRARTLSTSVEDRDLVVRLLQTLPGQQRRVVVLRYYNDLPERAVADILGISVGTVKSTASQGLASLRARLHPMKEDPV